MDAAFLSALSALAGSVVGGMTSGITTWLNQRSQARAALMAREMSRREDLYRDFVIAASKAYGDALINSTPQLEDLIALYSMVNRMRVLSLAPTVACADKVMVTVLDTYYAPNKTVDELHVLLKSGNRMDPLKEFSEAARAELNALAPR